MVKGTAAMGQLSKGLSHIICRRCGYRSMHRKARVCSHCGFGKTAHKRSYTWNKKNKHA